ncbi:hypothetical protein M0805_003125 [Coniferiporia weirii]|nr:hypothetical protein M0805_003125 [Coniferiporia weirii]
MSPKGRVAGLFSLKREPALPAFGKGKIVPEREASLLSKLVFNWLSPILSVGASRPLEKDDLWTLPAERRTAALASLIEANFYVRVPASNRPVQFRERRGSTAGGDADEKKRDEDNGGYEVEENEKDLEKAKDGQAGGSSMPELSNASASKGARKARPPPAFLRQRSRPGPDGKEVKYSKHPLLAAIHAAFFWRWWVAGSMKLCADTLNTTTPLITKLLLAWLAEAFAFAQSDGATPRPRSVGYGIGLGVALFAMQELSSLMTNHFMMMTMTNGLTVRTGVIGAIFRKSLRLSGRARAKHSVGQVTTMISTDATRLDLCSQYVHNLWVGPIQIVIGIALLINNLGYSALVGLGVLLLGFPFQFLLVRRMFTARKSGVQITDRRVRLTTEVLQGIRLIKFYAWEAFYAHRIGGLREKEIAKIRKIAIARAMMISVVTIVPILASVLSFITYALSGHNLNPSIIFSSLQFFNIIRAPLTFFPLVLTSCSDAVVALGRIGTFLVAEELEEPYVVDSSPENKWAIRAEGSFTWETVGRLEGGKYAPVKPGGSGKGRGKTEGGPGAKAKNESTATSESVTRKGWWSKKGKNDESVLPISTPPVVSSSSSTTADVPSPTPVKDIVEAGKADEKPFALTGLELRVPKGAFVAIVGRVGSGKSSLLQSLVGEMRKTDGDVVFGGSVAYVPQQPWIMNVTLRENILFGRDDDDEKFEEVVHACSLQHDIEMLPNGDQTEIGEKGINLSGGQKARVSLARAAYSDSEIVLLDDPLSAVDAHVGKAILEDCLLSGPLASKTRVLVTHALHVLARTDYIYMMEGGTITEEGTYQTLMKDGKAFSKLVEEFGALEEEETEEENPKAESKSGPTPANAAEKPDGMKQKSQLMSEEERNRGAVPLSTYSKFLQYAGSILWAPAIVLLLTLMQGASVGNNLFLGFWTASSIHGFSEGDYMGVYAALGVAQAFFSFVVSFTFSLIGLYASLRMFKAALRGVLRSPISFFDTTPMGRILSRLSKDQDTLDTQLSMTMFQLLSTFSNVIGTVALVFYTFPYLGIIFAPLGVLYYLVASYYRKSSVETKRLDSLMRSALYASYSETLTGLSTVRAYRAQRRFTDTAEHGLDLENRAYYMTVSIQRWLSVRLDLFGNILILGIAMFAAGFRTTVNPSKIGVVLSYSLSTQMVAQYALNEQNMNAVERVLVYTELPSEGLPPSSKEPPPSWPEKGGVKFEDVDLAYREGLPSVLKGVSFEVNAGEKIGIVGRTGAGKSSLLQALFRMVELRDGAIKIDGVNIQDVNLDVLRQKLALVPQDSTLFLGTLRENLDPQNSRTDAEIISALRRTWLLPPNGAPVDPVAEAKFSLDSAVGDEGSNFSAGEKQLLALCRALLKNSCIIVLDEATSSVDVETDAKIQRTIKTEFSECTLLCIAHRLNTIVYYDRVLVMDSGVVAEFDTPLNLFDKEDSIFRSLCDEAGLTRLDILRIRGEVPEAIPT